jgi:Sucrase/ferredoxin-like
VSVTAARPRCADVAAAAGDPLEGTAPPAEQWLLVEHPGPWDRYVLADPRLDRTAVVALDRWARAESGRVLFVRRPDRAGRVPQRPQWFRVDSRPGREAVRTGLFTDERELAAVVADPVAGEPDDGPLFVVCTHGRHDTCCAVRGRPLAAALAADHPDRTWEASHIGGCRFAAAMVLLPHGIVLGDVPVREGADVAALYAAGLVPSRGVRGRASLPPAVQAAQHHARLATGAYGVDALVPTDVRVDGPGSWRVGFSDPDVTVVLTEQRVDTGRALTCAATAPGWMRVFELVDVARATPVPS